MIYTCMSHEIKVLEKQFLQKYALFRDKRHFNSSEQLYNLYTMTNKGFGD